MKIGQLENKLLKKFPKQTAMIWDKTGLTCGDKNSEITKIAVALDVTVDAIKQAKKCGCNLLLTHHPAFLGEIENFQPADSVAISDGAVVYSAIENGVALMNFHTALDVSNAGASRLPNMLNLKVVRVLCPTDGLPSTKSKLGFGRICVPKPTDKILTVDDLSKRCKKVFNRQNRTWGNFSKSCEKIGITTGSVGRLDDDYSVLQSALDNNLDCLICGEIKYHDALEVCDCGLSVIDLGHDVSENPLCDILVKSCLDAGIKKKNIVEIEHDDNWR